MRALRSFLPRTLERRIVTLIVLLALFVTAVGTSVSVLVTRTVMHDSMDRQLRTAVSHPQASVQELASELPGGSLALWQTGDDVDIAAVGEDRTVTAADRDELGRLVQGPPGLHSVTFPDRDEMRVLVAVTPERRVLVATSDETTERDLAKLGLFEGVVWLLAGLLAAGVGALGTRRLTRPLREIAATTSDIAATPVGSVTDAVRRRVPEGESSVEEVDAVARSVNNLLEQVEEALRRRDEGEATRRAFLADVSHELRTPIAVVRSHAELSGSIVDDYYANMSHVWPARLEPGEKLTPAEADELFAAITALAPEGNQLRPSLERIEREGRRMGRLVDDLLVLARVEDERQLDDAEVDVTFIALEALSDATLLAPEHRWAFHAGDEPAVVVGDEASVRRVVTNLVANARRHTPAGTNVGVTVDVRDGGVVVRVEDNGPGLPEAVAASPGKRFGNRDRTSATSSGLGLAITTALMESVGGRLTFDSSPDGLTVEAWFPNERPRSDQRAPERHADENRRDADEH